MRTSPWVYDKSIPFTGGGRYTRKKSAVRCPLIRWKTVRFSIEDRVIALPVFAPDYSDLAKLGKYSNHANSALVFCYIKFHTRIPFGPLSHIEGMQAQFLSVRSKKIAVKSAAAANLSKKVISERSLLKNQEASATLGHKF